jgi:hypothetical protein
MFGQQDGANQLVVDEAAHDLHVGTIDRIARRRCSGGRDEMIECTDFVEQPGNLEGPPRVKPRRFAWRSQ